MIGLADLAYHIRQEFKVVRAMRNAQCAYTTGALPGLECSMRTRQCTQCLLPKSCVLIATISALTAAASKAARRVQAEKQLQRIFALDAKHVHALTLSGLLHFKAAPHPLSAAWVVACDRHM